VSSYDDEEDIEEEEEISLNEEIEDSEQKSEVARPASPPPSHFS
jgi:hypothetical protein